MKQLNRKPTSRARKELIGLAVLALPASALSVSPVAYSSVAISQSTYSLGSANNSISTVPKLIVLIHGATPAPSDPAMPLVPEPATGTLDFTRFYFSESFARQLLGAPSSIKTLSGVNVTGTQWNASGSPNSDNKVNYSVGVSESSLGDHFIVPGSHTGTGTPPVSLLLTYRDGSQRLMAQTKAIINQIYDKYTAMFGTAANPAAGKVMPSMILVTHSMGGLVSRTIMTAPSDPIQGATLTAGERLKAQAIRDRVIATVHLAVPNEGSPLADRATDIANWLKGDGKGMLDTFGLLLPDGLKSAADEARRSMARDLGKDANQDLRRDFWDQMNDGVLAPHLARRSDGSLIPIYTMIGHSPAGSYFVNPDSQWPTGGITSSLASSADNRRKVVRSVGLMAIDYALHNVPTSTTAKHWGTLGTAPADFDIVARYHRKSLGLTLSAPGEDEGVPWGLPKFYNRNHVTEEVKNIFGQVTGTRVVRTNKDGKIDADGLVSVASGHGLRLGTSTNNFFDHSSNWNVGGSTLRGSWYRIEPESAWKFSNHETIHRTAGVGEWIFLNIVSQAGPIPAAGELSVWPAPRFQLGTPITLSPQIKKIINNDED